MLSEFDYGVVHLVDEVNDRIEATPRHGVGKLHDRLTRLKSVTVPVLFKDPQTRSIGLYLL